MLSIFKLIRKILYIWPKEANILIFYIMLIHKITHFIVKYPSFHIFRLLSLGLKLIFMVLDIISSSLLNNFHSFFDLSYHKFFIIKLVHQIIYLLYRRGNLHIISNIWSNSRCYISTYSIRGFILLYDIKIARWMLI